MKIIFLDIDGVLTTLDSRWKLIPEKFDLLKQILDRTNAKIVLSSHWRRADLNATKEFLTSERNPYVNGNPFPFCDQLIDQTSHVAESTRFGAHDSRGKEIKKWLNEHTDIESFVIIDDDNDMLEEQYDNFVQTKWWVGLSEEDVEEAIRILNK